MSRLYDIKKAIDAAPKVPLGDYIESVDVRNTDGKYTINDVRGLSTQKQIIETKANMDGVSTVSYKLLSPEQFAYVADTSRRGEKISLGFNSGADIFLVSSISIVFRVKDIYQLDPMYLYLFFCRPEFDRYSRFNSWGSAREAFSFDEMCRVRIPLPPLDVQKEYVDAYDSLQQLIQQNEALLKPLSDACQAYMAEVKSKYDEVTLGDYIEEYIQINSDNGIKEVRGVSVSKFFVQTNAKVNKNDLRKYKIVPPGYIAYVQTTKNEKCFAFAINNDCFPIVVSAVDRVIYSKVPDILDANYLALWFRRKEWDRFAIFNSWGSAREVFSYQDFCKSRIPLPPLDVQKSIVALHKCAEEARSIAAEARETLRKMCPAMVQRAAHDIR